MAYFMRLYYDKSNGDVVSNRWAKGDIRVPNISEDFETFSELAGR